MCDKVALSLSYNPVHHCRYRAAWHKWHIAVFVTSKSHQHPHQNPSAPHHSALH